MTVILTDMDMPDTCAYCEFAKRLDNIRCFCERNPTYAPVSDWEPRPDFCPLMPVKQNEPIA